jgi:hypothetical protein
VKSRQNSVEVPTASDILTREHAPAQIGFDSKTFNIWVCRGLLPRPDPITSGWTKAALDEAIQRVRCDGIQNDNPRRRHAHFIKIYNCKHIWRDRQRDGGGWHFYFTPLWEKLPGSWGSPKFMSALIDCERRHATQKLAANASQAPAQQPQNQSPAAAQPSQDATSPPPKLVTRNPTEGALDQAVSSLSPPPAPPSPGPNATEIVTRAKLTRRPDSPRHLVVRMTRRRAAVTQAEIARVIRAAKQAGAAQVELRLNDSSIAVIRLQPDNSVASDDEEIIL